MVGDPLDAWLADFERHLRVANRSPETATVYLRSVRQLLDHVRASHPVDQPADITARDVESWALAMTEAGRSESTRRVRLLAARVFFAWVRAEPDSGMTRNPAAAVPLPTVHDVPRPMPTLDDVRAVLKTAAGARLVDVRDTALLLLLVDCGLRRSELVSLDVEDVDVRAAQILVRRGKGGHARLVATGDRATLATSRWIRVRRRHPGAGEPALFLSTRPDASGSRRLTPGAVAVLLTRRCAQAGVPAITPHLLRHLWAHSLAASGVRET